MILGIRNTQEKQVVNCVELVKVVQPDLIPGMHHTAEIPRISNMTTLEKKETP